MDDAFVVYFRGGTADGTIARMPMPEQSSRHIPCAVAPGVEQYHGCQGRNTDQDFARFVTRGTRRGSSVPRLCHPCYFWGSGIERVDDAKSWTVAAAGLSARKARAAGSAGGFDLVDGGRCARGGGKRIAGKRMGAREGWASEFRARE